ncbi:MAG: response regulator transcription factor [Acidobacteriia bacterium]|nr:response regulator transcription factor [Terriglobia bacterium]
MPAPRVILVDDNPEFLERTRTLLMQDFHVIASFDDGHALIAAWSELKPDIVVSDISMPPLSGLVLARKLTEQGYSGPIVFLTIHNERDFVTAALAAGASGYVLKSHMTSELIPALNAVLSGEKFFSASLLH